MKSFVNNLHSPACCFCVQPTSLGFAFSVEPLRMKRKMRDGLTPSVICGSLNHSLAKMTQHHWTLAPLPFQFLARAVSRVSLSLGSSSALSCKIPLPISVPSTFSKQIHISKDSEKETMAWTSSATHLECKRQRHITAMQYRMRN